MFDPNGGMQNIFIAGLNILCLILLVGFPVYFLSNDRKYKLSFVVGSTGFAVYCFLLYVANPSLSFWKV